MALEKLNKDCVDVQLVIRKIGHVTSARKTYEPAELFPKHTLLTDIYLALVGTGCLVNVMY